MIAFKKNDTIPILLSLGIYGIVFAYCSSFGYAYEIPKFLVFSITVCLLSYYFFKNDTALRVPQNKILNTSAILSLGFLVASAANATHGPTINSLCIFSLWLLLTVLSSQFASEYGQDVFIKKIIQFTLPLNTFAIFYLALMEYLLPEEAIKPFFGNVNLAADFVSIVILQSLFHLEMKPSSEVKKILYGIILLSVGVLLSFSSRAAILGTTLSVLYILSSRRKLEFIRKYFSIITLGALPVLGLLFYFGKGISTLKLRYAMWGNTLYMIKENLLLGVGPGAFDIFFEKHNGAHFPSPERSEGFIVSSPHNFILEITAVTGILCSLIFMFSFSYLIYKTYNQCNEKNKFARRWSLSFVILYLCLMFFAFPQNMPTTLLFLSLVTGVLFSFQNSHLIHKSKLYKLLTLVYSTFVFFTLAIKAYADYLTVTPQENRIQYVEKACQLDPENWRACAIWTRMNIQANKIDDAKHALDIFEKKYKGFHPDHILRGELALKENNIALACDHFKKYDALYYPRSSKTEFIHTKCNLNK